MIGAPLLAILLACSFDQGRSEAVVVENYHGPEVQVIHLNKTVILDLGVG
jgi:hypothetical protein